MKKWKKKRVVAVLLTLLVLLQFPADFGSVAHAAQKNEIRGTISAASNISQQDMQQYLDGFNKKYPGIEVKYQSYSDYDNEVSKQIQGGDYPDVLFVPALFFLMHSNIRYPAVRSLIRCPAHFIYLPAW